MKLNKKYSKLRKQVRSYIEKAVHRRMEKYADLIRTIGSVAGIEVDKERLRMLDDRIDELVYQRLESIEEDLHILMRDRYREKYR